MSFFSGSDLQIYPASFKVMGLPSLRFRVTAFLRCLAWIRHDQTTQPTILSKSKKLKGDSFRVTKMDRNGGFSRRNLWNNVLTYGLMLLNISQISLHIYTTYIIHTILTYHWHIGEKTRGYEWWLLSLKPLQRGRCVKSKILPNKKHYSPEN